MRNPPRLKTPTVPGEAPVLISSPIARLLERTCGIDAFLRAVRTGSLDGSRSPTRFNTTAGGMEKLRSMPSGRHLPEGMPEMRGEITGRRATGMFSLDVAEASFGDDLNWNEMLPRGMGDAQLRIEGVELPPSVLANLPGRPLRDILDHPALAREDVVVLGVAASPARTAMTMSFPASLELRLRVPRTTHDDHDPRPKEPST
jgi:hypothetical protein